MKKFCDRAVVIDGGKVNFCGDTVKAIEIYKKIVNI